MGVGFEGLPLPEGIRISEREAESEVSKTEASAKDWEADS